MIDIASSSDSWQLLQLVIVSNVDFFNLQTMANHRLPASVLALLFWRERCPALSPWGTLDVPDSRPAMSLSNKRPDCGKTGS